MKKIGLDVGDKTIGVAVSDALNITAQGIMTIERIGIKKDTDKVIALIKEHMCDTVVIGLPLKLDGTDSPQTEKVRDFRIKLEKFVKLGFYFIPFAFFFQGIDLFDQALFFIGAGKTSG